MFRALCSVALALAMWALPAMAQNRVRPMLEGLPGMGISDTPTDPARAEWQARALRVEDQNRQIALKQDTNKLLQLATELKQSVDRTVPNILSVDVIKKAQEIEKLAKSVKDKMKGN